MAFVMVATMEFDYGDLCGLLGLEYVLFLADI